MSRTSRLSASALGPSPLTEHHCFESERVLIPNMRFAGNPGFRRTTAGELAASEHLLTPTCRSLGNHVKNAVSR